MGIRQLTHQRTLLSAATDRRILTLLPRARMSLRRQRRDNSFYHRLAETGRNPRVALESDLADLLPARREWPRPGTAARNAARTNGLDAVSIALVDWLLSNFSTPRRSSPAWLKRLRKFVGSVRTRIRDWGPESKFESPKVYALLKSRATDAGKADSFRGLAVYGLSDRLVISIAARHLREVTDAIMHPGSLAFRTQSPTLTHHDAVEHILRFRDQYESSEKWVAEVDIRGFFDVVSHDVARRAVSHLLETLPAEQRPDSRALSILDVYLDSYAFNMGGRDQAFDQARKQQRQGHGVDVPWPDAELRALGVDVKRERVGIPQGGALSCFLANAILDQADWAVENAIKAGRGDAADALYLRYCDDIICLATSRDQCDRMLNAYASSLVDLKLPAHEMLVFDRPYERSRKRKQPSREREKGGFWKGKSKAPYRWSPAGAPGSVPWCAFVGYHVRHDGKLRLRPSSVKREIEKHNLILGQVQRFIRRKGQARSKRQIVYRVRQRLRAIAVGTGSVGNGPMPPPFSWTRGFRLLAKHASLTGQLRDLDRHRVATVAALRRRLKRKGTGAGVKKLVPVLKFEGFPFSYAGLAERRRTLGRSSSGGDIGSTPGVEP